MRNHSDCDIEMIGPRFPAGRVNPKRHAPQHKRCRALSATRHAKGTAARRLKQVREIVFVEQDVGRFGVAVHQADPVRGLQRFGHLLDDPHCPPRL